MMKLFRAIIGGAILCASPSDFIRSSPVVEFGDAISVSVGLEKKTGGLAAKKEKGGTARKFLKAKEQEKLCNNGKIAELPHIVRLNVKVVDGDAGGSDGEVIDMFTYKVTTVDDCKNFLLEKSKHC